MSQVTDNDRSMVDYFINEKGDITRWSSWNSRKEIIFAAYPELRVALDNKVIAERTLDAIVRRIRDEETTNDT